MEEGEGKSSRHFLLNFIVFARVSLKHLGGQIFGEPGEVAGINISRFVDLVNLI